MMSEFQDWLLAIPVIVTLLVIFLIEVTER